MHKLLAHIYMNGTVNTRVPNHRANRQSIGKSPIGPFRITTLSKQNGNCFLIFLQNEIINSNVYFSEKLIFWVSVNIAMYHFFSLLKTNEL